MAIATLSELFTFVTTQYNKPDHLFYRGHDRNLYKLSTNEFRERVTDFALGLRELGVKPETKVILVSENRPEWHVVDFACHLLGAVVVPIFPTLIPEQVQYIAEDSDSEFIVVSTPNQAEKVASVRAKLKRVKQVIAMDPEVEEAQGTPFAEVLKTGREFDAGELLARARERANPDVIATLIYTSGTTGQPKGVMLSHRNLVSNFLACGQVFEITAEDRGLSFLPLSHAFERTVDYLYFYRGATIVYSRVEDVPQDLVETQPTIMAAVPRFYEKVKAAVESKAEEAGGLKKKLFNWAIRVGRKKAESELGLGARRPLDRMRFFLADRLVLSQIRARTGGRVRFFISGGAPLSPEVAWFFYAAGLKILEGYGLTETSPVVSVNPPERPKLGTVGKPLPGVEVGIAEDGEIMVRGPSVMMGYYKRPEETNEVLQNGWFYTGDIGERDDDGYLKITDRKKQLMVTSVGKKVAPQAIEKEVENSRFIEQVMLIGEKRNFVTALIVPDFQALRTYFNESNAVSNEELVQRENVKALIQQELDERQRHLSNYEKIRKFALLPEAFTVENGLLTPTMKVKRRLVEERYAQLIEDLYRN